MHVIKYDDVILNLINKEDWHPDRCIKVDIIAEFRLTDQCIYLYFMLPGVFFFLFHSVSVCVCVCVF